MWSQLIIRSVKNSETVVTIRSLLLCISWQVTSTIHTENTWIVKGALKWSSGRVARVATVWCTTPQIQHSVLTGAGSVTSYQVSFRLRVSGVGRNIWRNNPWDARAVCPRFSEKSIAFYWIFLRIFCLHFSWFFSWLRFSVKAILWC